MNNLFDLISKKPNAKKSIDYGMSGELKKTQFLLELIGSPYDLETLKCILTAAEQGMEMNCYSVVADTNQDVESSIKQLAPLYMLPCLKEADFICCGSNAITSFIDARGLGYPLTPRNAALAATQNYWTDIADNNVAPQVKLIVEEVFTKKHNDPKHIANTSLIEECLSNLHLYLDALNEQLSINKYIICNKYTWADLYWTANLHLCALAGYNHLITERPNINRWFKRIKAKKSQCGQDIIAYHLLPTIDDMIAGNLNSVVIKDY